jgi:Domain of unknown function (DUF2019)
MSRENLVGLSVAELVQRFIDVAREQQDAELRDDRRDMRALYWKMDAVRNELKARAGDQRRALVPLLRHPNVQVRLKAAKSTLSLDPEGARRTLDVIFASGIQPQAMEAGMSIWNLDRGVFKPS